MPRTASQKGSPASPARKRSAKPTPNIPLPGVDVLRFRFTDIGNAERLIACFGDRIRYCTEWKTWLVWDGSRWRADTSREVHRLAKHTIRSFYAHRGRIGSPKDREVAEAHARRSESAAAIRAMLACAESEPGIAVSATELDKDPWLLNCRNGTIDLQKGGLRRHRQSDLISKLSPVAFKKGAKCPTFLAFLNRILGGDPSLIAYLQRALGYALTGQVSEKACFCLFGEGNNGKTTLLELFRYILGDYAAQVMIDTLMTRRAQESNATLADLADLRGARFVTTSETEAGQRLAEGKLKYLTGMSEVKTCRKYENPITFSPTHKIFMDANHRPVVRGSDPAIWARLKLLPFTVSIPEDQIDKALLVKLKAEAPGVLAWAVRGCLDWQQRGLAEPIQVATSVDSWKTEDDPYREFIEDECEFDPSYVTPVSDLLRTLSSWAQENGIRYPSKNELYKRLRARGCTKGAERPDGTNKQFRCWKGVKV